MLTSEYSGEAYEALQKLSGADRRRLEYESVDRDTMYKRKPFERE